VPLPAAGAGLTLRDAVRHQFQSPPKSSLINLDAGLRALATVRGLLGAAARWATGHSQTGQAPVLEPRTARTRPCSLPSPWPPAHRPPAFYSAYHPCRLTRWWQRPRRRSTRPPRPHPQVTPRAWRRVLPARPPASCPARSSATASTATAPSSSQPTRRAAPVSSG
jgi:hypothetical protein